MISNAISLMIIIPLIGALVSFFAGAKAKFVALIAGLAETKEELSQQVEEVSRQNSGFMSGSAANSA